MASFVYLEAKKQIIDGDIHFDTDDLRVLLVKSATTADTETTATTLSGFTTLDEMSGTGYVRKALTESTSKDTPNNRAEAMASAVTWTGLNAGTADAAIIYKHVTNDSDSIPLIYIDSGGFPVVTNGSDVTITFNAEGYLQAS
jgi:hypothetical protein